MPDVMPLPHGVGVAVEALGAAGGRLKTAVGQVLRGGGGKPVWMALSESLFWVAAIDDELRHHPDYYADRAASEEGRTVGGLVYARNRHAHELVSTGHAVFRVGQGRVVVTPPGEQPPPPGRGTLFSMQMSWAPIDHLPASQKRETHGRDAMYSERVAERPLTHPIEEALTWLGARVVGTVETFGASS